MDDFFGLQRAILASLGAPPPPPSSLVPHHQPLRSHSNRAGGGHRAISNGGAGAGTAQDWGLRGVGGPSSSSSIVTTAGRRNQLEREGIMPRQGHTFQSGKTTTNSKNRAGAGTIDHQQNGPSSSSTLHPHDDELANGSSSSSAFQMPRRGFYDKLISWKELSTGGRSQAQNPAQDHILMVTDESLPDRLSSFQGTEALLIAREEPIDMLNTSNNGKGCTVRMQLKSLTGSGRYSTFAIGFATKSFLDGSAKGFVGLSVHYEFTGAVYVSVDEWTIVKETSASTPLASYKRLERTLTLEKAQQVKPKRDGLEIRIPFTNRSIDVIINDHLHFKNVMGCELAGDSEEVFVCLVAAGGRFSAKHLDISDGLHSSGSPRSGGGSGAGVGLRVGSSSPPPLAPTRSNPSLRGGAPCPIAGRRAPSRQPATAGGGSGGAASNRIGTNARASPSPRVGARGGANPSSSGSIPRGPSSGINNQHGYNPDDPFIQMVEAEIIDRSPNVVWEDVAGVNDAKAVLNEAVVLPLLVPELFTGVRQPWKGVLLYGPPGTGKTMLAKGVATSAKTTFYSISASTLLSKFHGESEKLVKALFQSARANAPSTIFFDEIDAIMSKRGGANEHDASRRLKAEMLQQIDGVGTSAEDGRVMLLAATNTPWDLDEAMRRRLEKRIYVPLPDESGRYDFLKRQTRVVGKTKEGGNDGHPPPPSGGMPVDNTVDLHEIARLTDGYSGADMNQLCRDAAMMPMRRLIADKSPMQIAEMKQRGELTVLPTSREDFLAALAKVKPSVSKNELGKYEEWTQQFSSI